MLHRKDSAVLKTELHNNQTFDWVNNGNVVSCYLRDSFPTSFDHTDFFNGILDLVNLQFLESIWRQNWQWVIVWHIIDRYMYCKIEIKQKLLYYYNSFNFYHVSKVSIQYVFIQCYIFELWRILYIYIYILKDL